MPQKQPRIGRAVVDQVPKVFRLQSIKSRIVGLALLSTLIPSWPWHGSRTARTVTP